MDVIFIILTNSVCDPDKNCCPSSIKKSINSFFVCLEEIRIPQDAVSLSWSSVTRDAVQFKTEITNGDENEGVPLQFAWWGLTVEFVHTVHLLS